MGATYVALKKQVGVGVDYDRPCLQSLMISLFVPMSLLLVRHGQGFDFTLRMAADD